MRISPAGTHLGGDPDRFHHFLLRCPLVQGALGVAIDALGTLRHVGDGDGDQILHFARQRAVGEDAFAECLECGRRVRCQFVALTMQRAR